MPVTQITLLPGYPEDVRARLVDHVSKAVRSVIAAPAAGVTTMVQEVATYQRDGRVFTTGNAAHPKASDLVAHYLQCMEQRDLAAARQCLASDFAMVFPGGAVMHDLTQLVQWASQRYQSVRKTYDGFDEAWTDDCTVVYARGTLSGIWLDGTGFKGIRFIDRFEVAAGLLRKQEVWNDLGEALGQRTPSP
jgi:phenylpyruvate tautomerase PptA (4-oxalocrotonate tautomerase family)